MKTKWNLNKSEQMVHSANLERLKSGGVAIGVEETASSESPLLGIEQSDYSFIHAGTRKGIAFEICLRLIALKPGVTLRDGCEITIPGCDDLTISLVPLPEGCLSYKALWGINIERGAVLNHLFFDGRPLPCDRIFDGILVAQSFGSLPTYFQTGTIDAEICLFDQLDNPYTSKVEFIVTRYAPECARKGDGLFGPKQVGGTRHQPQVNAHLSSAFGGAVNGGKEKMGEIVSTR